MKLAAEQEFTYIHLDGNTIPIESRGSISVSCIAYKDKQNYYVEVGVSNRSAESLSLARGFVEFEKLGYTVFMTNTLVSAHQLRASVSGKYVAAPPPLNTTTTYSGSAITTGNITTVQGRAQTTDNSGWYRLGQAIAAQRYYKAQSREQSFATYLEMFANERQPLTIGANEIQLYIFTFQQLKPKKEQFTIRVHVGKELFPFSYNE